MRKIISYLFLLLFCIFTQGQNIDTVADKLVNYASTFDYVSKYLPQEKIYLHFDNTSYYQGDNIWFACYIVNSQSNKPINLSKTLYVELLNPGGEVVGKQVLKIDNGQCHGNFLLDRLPFYSGLYEVRAYTKYLLNFGEDVIFSRVLPVFNNPKEDGNFEEKTILKYGYGNYPNLREKPRKNAKVNLKLFPEGGNLVHSITSQVAFEATDEFGNPIEITGSIVNEKKEEIIQFSSLHEGKGVFSYIPTDEKQKAIVLYNDIKYEFDIPNTQSSGFVMHVDNLSSKDSIEITIQKNEVTPPEKLCVTIISGGKLNGFYLVDISNDEVTLFNIDKAKLPQGVSRIILYNSIGKILGDRLVFVNKKEWLNIQVKTDKGSYNPYELVNMDFTITNQLNNPVHPTFSLSVRDGMNEVKFAGNILENLLLTSEIKGFIRNPAYYFESDADVHRKALDVLMMVQGWRRYSWGEIAGIEAFELKHKPEQGLEVNGKVVSLVRSIPKSDVQISAALVKSKEEKENIEEKEHLIDILDTDSLGRFSFVTDVQGRWDLMFAVTKENKKKDYRILLDRLFSPQPRKYESAEMKIDVNSTKIKPINEENFNTQTEAYKDSLARTDIKNDGINLDEVLVTAKKNSEAEIIYKNRSNSLAYFDAQTELDDIKDENEYIGDDIKRLLVHVNKDFMLMRKHNAQKTDFQREADANFDMETESLIEYLQYKGKTPLYIYDYKRNLDKDLDLIEYNILKIEAVKSIYISEDRNSLYKYADSRKTSEEIDRTYSCVVFIETFPEGKIPVESGKGVRKTKLEGYSEPKEFYSPEYSQYSPEPDYRRTIYWNPSITPDKEGKVHIQFYNNSQCKTFKVNAEGITSDGIIGAYEN